MQTTTRKKRRTRSRSRRTTAAQARRASPSPSPPPPSSSSSSSSSLSHASNKYSAQHSHSSSSFDDESDDDDDDDDDIDNDGNDGFVLGGSVELGASALRAHVQSAYGRRRSSSGAAHSLAASDRVNTSDSTRRRSSDVNGLQLALRAAVDDELSSSSSSSSSSSAAAAAAAAAVAAAAAPSSSPRRRAANRFGSGVPGTAFGALRATSVHHERLKRTSKTSLWLQHSWERDFWESRSFSIFPFRSGGGGFRRFILRLVESSLFSSVIFVAILVNCVIAVLAVEGQINESTAYALDAAFVAIFAAEALLKMCALGAVWHRGAYARDAWNVLDFALLLQGALSLLPGVPNVTALRALRSLRAMRAINKLYGMKLILTSLFRALASLRPVGVLIAFIFCTAALFALQAFSGTLHQRCVWSQNATFVDEDVRQARLCSPSATETTSDFFSTLSGRACPTGAVCVTNFNDANSSSSSLFDYSSSSSEPFSNPLWGFLSFDNFFASLLTLFAAASLDGWVFTMYFVQDATTVFAGVFFVLWVIVGITLTNMMLAIVIGQFADAHVEEQRRRRARTGSSVAMPTTTTTTTTTRTDDSSYRKKMPKINEKDIVNDDNDDNDDDDNDEGIVGTVVEKHAEHLSAMDSALRAAATAATCAGSTATSPSLTSPRIGGKYYHKPSEATLSERQFNLAAVDWLDTAAARVRAFVASRAELPARATWRRTVHRIVEHPLCEAFVMLLIVANVVVMATAHYGMSTEAVRTLELLNYAFVAAFTVEVVARIVGSGFFAWAKDALNVFDAFVVLVSILEIILVEASGNDGGGASQTAAASFRLLRVFRVFKLARRWRAMQHIVRMIRRAIVPLVYVTLVLGVFLFIFALAARIVFDGRVAALDGLLLPRATFKTFYHAFMTTFHVMIGDSWTTVMYQSMRVSVVWGGTFNYLK